MQVHVVARPLGADRRQRAPVDRARHRRAGAQAALPPADGYDQIIILNQSVQPKKIRSIIESPTCRPGASGPGGRALLGGHRAHGLLHRALRRHAPTVRGAHGRRARRRLPDAPRPVLISLI